MIVNFSQWGDTLISRQLGKEVNQYLKSWIAREQGVIVLDFSGVEIVSNSFADEVFGKLVCEIGLEKLRARTTFANHSPFIAKVIKSAITEREKYCCVDHSYRLFSV